MLDRYWRGVVFALCAACGWGLMSPLAKMLLADGVSLVSVMTFRAAFVVVCMGVWLLIRRGKEVFLPDCRTLRFYAVSGMLSVVFSGAGFLMSLKYLSVAEALILHYTFPLVTMLGSAYITKERPGPLQVLAGFMIVAALYVGMAGGEKNLSAVSVPGLLWGLVAITGISGQALWARRASLEIDVDPYVMLFFTHLTGMLVLVAAKSLLAGWADLQNIDCGNAHILILQALSGSLIAYGFFFSALTIIPAATVSLLCTAEIVVAVASSAVLIGAVPSAREVFACAAIICSVAVSTAAPESFLRRQKNRDSN